MRTEDELNELLSQMDEESRGDFEAYHKNELSLGELRIIELLKEIRDELRDIADRLP